MVYCSPAIHHSSPDPIGGSAPLRPAGPRRPRPYTPAVDRERWTSLPASAPEELALLDAINGTSASRTVTALASDGRARPLAAVLSIGVEAPFDGKADVVVRLVFEGAGLRPGERFAADPWDLLDQFLRDARADAEARRRAARRP